MSETTPKTRTPGTDADLVFPIGHYLGPFHPSRGAAARHHVVRVGWDTPKLPDEEHLDVWALAHGLPDRITDGRWTRADLLQAAEESGVHDAAVILDRMIAEGLVAQVGAADGEGAHIEFARRHRVQSLLVGLGNSPQDPALDAIGLPGLPPVVKVRPRVMEIWQWAHLWPDLWSATAGLAQVAQDAGSDDPDEAEAARLLEFVLGAVRTLLSRNAVYLDVAVRPGSGAGT